MVKAPKRKQSNNYHKARSRSGKAHLKVSRQREEFAKRVALRLIQSNDLVAFQDYLLREIEQPLVLVLDKIDSIFAYSEIAEDFLTLLRAWYEEAKTIKVWKKLRLVLVYSTEVYLPLSINKSPFNVGVFLELPEFLPEQIRELSCRYQLNLNTKEIEQIITMLGGHPYLIQIALHHLVTEKITVENFLHLVTKKKSPYNKYLQQIFNNLQQHSESKIAS